MKRRKRTNIWKIGVISALTMASLTGCGEEEKVDYSIEGLEESEQPESEGGKTGLAQFEEEENWKDKWMVKIGETEWEGQIIDSMMEININAPITVPQVKEMSVIEVEEVEFDAEWKSTVAENIFDEGQIYYWDVSHLPKNDLRERQNLLVREDEMLISADNSLLYDAGDEILTRYANLQDAVDNIENAPDTYTTVEEYTVNEYIGTYEGRMYYLSFSEAAGNNWNNYRRMRQIVCMVRDLKEVCPEKYKEQENPVCSPWMRGAWIDNQCEISEEEALEKATEFAEQLGLDYPVYSYSRPLLWGRPPEYVTEESATGDWGIDGYVFYFDLGVDNLSFVGYGAEEDYWRFGTKKDQNVLYSMNSQLQVYVTDQGVIRMVANNPMEITGVSDGVELLPLDTIKGIMQGTMNEKWDVLSLDDEGYITTADSMELIYFRVSDKENPGKYSYVPAWRLGNVTRDSALHQVTIRIPVLINAIDGSFINVDEEW